jgi:hypothetical protein
VGQPLTLQKACYIAFPSAGNLHLRLRCRLCPRTNFPKNPLMVQLNGSILVLMGMESPETAQKADDPYRCSIAVGACSEPAAMAGFLLGEVDRCRTNDTDRASA